MGDLRNIKVFSGSSHPVLAEEICGQLGVELEQMYLTRFACGEIYGKPTVSVRNQDVFVIQTASANVNEDLMELFIMLDALERSFAGRIHVIMPHFAYARQDRVATPREPISAKLVANLIGTAGADHLITMRLHSDQTQGFFNFPVDNVNTDKLFADYFVAKKIKDLVVVSPDAGGAKAAKKLADRLGAELAIIHKSRPAHNEVEVSHVVGEVEGRTCLLFDDMIDTAGSVTAAKAALLKAGALPGVYLAATHAVFSGPAVERLTAAAFEEVVVTNTIPLVGKEFPGLKVLSVAPLLAKIIRSVHEGGSVTEAMEG